MLKFRGFVSFLDASKKAFTSAVVSFGRVVEVQFHLG